MLQNGIIFTIFVPHLIFLPYFSQFNLESVRKITTKRRLILFFFSSTQMADPIIQNQATPPPSPVPPIPAQTSDQTSAAHAASAQATRTGSKVSIKTFLIGCGVILLFVV